ncbi:Histone-lysine N-methyltransferase SETMAR, partial [Harpegnathos saltator]
DTRHERVILQHDNAPCHRTSIVQDTIKTLKWDLPPHPPYSPDLASSDYHFIPIIRSMAHGLAGQHLANFEKVQNWLDEWFRSKDASFYRRGIHVLPERWQKYAASEG